MRQALHKQIGSIKTLTIEGAANGPCVVLFHGYGADASDLIPLSDMMKLSKDVTWVFPEAPMEVIIAPGFYGKAWFQIDNRRLEAAMANGEPIDMSNTTPPGLEAARKSATTLYDELIKKHSRVVIGGFSQGAMLATEIAMTHEKKPAALVLMSGTVICKERWLKLAPSCAGVKFIQSHGKNDVLLGYEYAENLFSLLTDAGLSGEFMSFGGGHEIPPKVIEKISQFLSRICVRGIS
jgi:phospholipase/carboxylesterase